MNISVFDTVTVSERSVPLIPGLSQAGLSVVSGSSYRLMFDTTITSGILEVYQGTQLIYSSSIVFVGAANFLYDIVHVTEKVILDKRTSFTLNNSISVLENISLSLSYLVSKSESITITENITLNII